MCYEWYPDHVWKQLKNISADELVQVLEKDGFIFEGRRSSVLGYYNPTSRKRVTIHYHPGKTYGPNLLKRMIREIGWNIADFKRLKLIR